MSEFFDTVVLKLDMKALFLAEKTSSDGLISVRFYRSNELILSPCIFYEVGWADNLAGGGGGGGEGGRHTKRMASERTKVS